MRSTRRLSLVFAVLALIVGSTLGGCGNSSNSNNSATDQAQLALMCNDFCNTMIACAQELSGNTVPEENLQAGLAMCLEDCPALVNPEDVAPRDCAVACDTGTDCGTFITCVCDCGVDLEGLCDLAA